MSKNCLEVTTCGFCSVNCYYCPQDIYQKRYSTLKSPKFLSLGSFKQALDSVPKEVTIVFSGFSEPFLNKETVDMIEYAYNVGHPIILFSTLVGLKLADVERLARVKYVAFYLHLPDNLGNAKIPITSYYRKVLSTVLSSIRVDSYIVMNENFKSNHRAGNCKDSHRLYKKGWFLCDRLRHPSIIMLPNCDVVLCCMDFGLKHVLGNLLHESYADIINGEKFSKIRSSMFSWDSDILCRSCDWALSPPKYLLRFIVLLFAKWYKKVTK